jgi:molecular chaperone DnaJ
LIDDEETSMKIPAGTKSGSKFRIRDKGMVVLNSGGRRGDVIVTVEVEIPTADTQEERDLYTKLDEILKKKEKTESGFFKKWFK